MAPMLAEYSGTGSADKARASVSPGLLSGTKIWALVMHDNDRRSGARNASRACGGVLPGKGQEHHEMLHLRPVHVERASVVRCLELLQGHAKLPAGSLVEHLAAFLTAQLDHAGLGGDRVHGRPPLRFRPWSQYA